MRACVRSYFELLGPSVAGAASTVEVSMESIWTDALRFMGCAAMV
eukprot:COSAG06_NODE_66200_length_255_cov_0.576923_1_plen_44_part_10